MYSELSNIHIVIHDLFKLFPKPVECCFSSFQDFYKSNASDDVQYLVAFGFWLFVCACVCDCVRSRIMIDWQWERQHHPKLAEKPYIPGLRAVNLNTDYRLKHVARSHHCFSKYFQSWGLEIIASGQGWDWFPKQALCVVVVRFYWRFENKKISFTCPAKALEYVVKGSWIF